MIEFSNENIIQSIKQVWKTCFGDSDAYIDLRFGAKYRHKNTLVYKENDTIVACLHMTPYLCTFYGKEIPIYYLEGLSTLPEWRGRGYMDKLIKKAHEVAAEREILLTVLIPAGPSLFPFYHKYGYTQISDNGTNDIGLKELVDKASTIEHAYEIFETRYRSNDFCIQKSFDDFCTIMEEHAMEGYPPKFDLAAMGRIIDARTLLDIFAHENEQTSAVIQVEDKNLAINNGTFKVQNGKCTRTTDSSHIDLHIDISFLCRLLFGYHTDKLASKYEEIFRPHHMTVNLLLE